VDIMACVRPHLEIERPGLPHCLHGRRQGLLRDGGKKQPLREKCDDSGVRLHSCRAV
jgi:hypothetical protein